MAKPFFSVIVPVHNASKYIDKCLCSIINQTFTNYEVLIIDDASEDNTVEVIEKIIKKYYNFRIYKLKKNSGVAEARNKGIHESKGKYICFLDDDDIWLKNKLQVEYKYILSKKLDWVFGNYEVLDENYRHIGTRFRLPGKYDYKKILNHGNPVGLLTVAVNAEILKNNHFQNVGHEDYDLWLRIARQGYKGYLIRDVLAQYLKRSNSRSSNKIKSIIWTFECFKRNGCSNFKSIKLIINYGYNTLNRKLK